MGINILQVGDKLRVEPGGIVFKTIGSNMIDRPLVDANVEIVSPIYGNTYLRKNNPAGLAYSNVSVELTGEEASFLALKPLCESNTLTEITLVIGGDTIPINELCSGVLTAVSYQKDILNPEVVTGNISLINLQ